MALLRKETTFAWTVFEYYETRQEAESRAAALNGANPNHKALVGTSENLSWTSEGEVVWSVYYQNTRGIRP